jgi:hypothetical protein
MHSLLYYETRTPRFDPDERLYETLPSLRRVWRPRLRLIARRLRHAY